MVREAVVAAVLLAEPASVEQAKLLVSRLCAFLAWLPVSVWDRETVVDLDAVLTTGRIAEFTSSVGMPTHSRSSRDAFRVALTRIRKAQSGLRSVRLARSAKAPVASKGFWPQVTGRGPFPVLIAAYADSGGSMHVNVWAGLAGDLTARWDLSTINAGPASSDGSMSQASGTVTPVRAAAAALRDATTLAGEVSSTIATTSSTTVTPPATVGGTRRPSRAAVLRAAKAAAAERAVAAGTAAEAGGVEGAPVQVLDEALMGLLDGWSPQGFDDARWAVISEAARAAVVAYRPGSAGVLRNVRSIVVPFADWLQAREGRDVLACLRVEEFLADGAVDRYLAGPLAKSPDGSRATVRSVLRRVVRNLSPEAAPEKIAYQPVQAPYTAAECARFTLLARNQPTDPLRRSMSAMVALGLGAGLGAEDQRVIAPRHIREIDLGEFGTALAVDVPGTRAWTVIMRGEFEGLLRDALELHAKARRGKATPLCGVKPDRKNGANRVAAKAVTATETGVDVSAARLRATWLVACMSAPVPLGALLHASGLKTPRTLTDLLPYCPAPDPEAVAAVLRGLEATSLTGAVAS